MAAATLKEVAKRLRAAALSYPGAVEDFPWGERVVKVKGKVFVFMGHDEDDGSFGLSCKLPRSAGMATQLPFAEPTGYNLGKSGWVSASFTSARRVPLPLLFEWIEESYRAVAPKQLVAELDAAQGGGAVTEPTRRPPRPRARARAKASGPRAASGRPRKRR